MKKLFTILLFSSAIWACNNQGPTEPPAEDSLSKAKVDTVVIKIDSGKQNK